ncbi:hypothetical protein [Paraburkholderia terrae]
MQRTYNTTVNLARDSGFRVRGMGAFGGDIQGQWPRLSLVPRSAEQAAAEARIDDHIEHLVGVAE